MNDSCAKKRVVIATGNAGKVRDFQSVFDAHELPIEVSSIKAFGGMPFVDETEATFAGNAKLKADAAKSKLSEENGLWVLADDSGICVDALEGAPGVQSARYAGEDASDADNRAKLLLALQGFPVSERGAHFVCHLVLISPEGEYHNFEGRAFGRIAEEASGEQGFGYDPLFVPEGKSITWGDMPDSEKNADSHRARATQKMINFLTQ